VTILPWMYGYYSSIHFKLLTHRLGNARPVAKWTLEWKGTHIRVLNLISWLDSTGYAGISSFSRLYDLHAGTSQFIGPSGQVISPTQRSLLDNTTLTTDRQPCPPAGFEPAIPGNERSHTRTFERVAAGIGYKYTDTAQLLDKWS
jgi:hypothetical protein